MRSQGRTAVKAISMFIFFCKSREGTHMTLARVKKVGDVGRGCVVHRSGSERALQRQSRTQTDGGLLPTG